MLTKEQKADIVRRYASNPKDTGTTVVQIAFLAKRIQNISAHLKARKNDHSSERGLLRLVGQRRSLFRYLDRRDPEAAKKLRSDLDVG
ncbi:MAG: 30S ribosomal protein S15 [Elusimicrobia bacterium]|nr:30S ribosomal protein S15 [Elusimicrobiota bacterium]